MEQKNKLLFFNIIAVFIFLSWVYYFNNDNTFNISLNENCKHRKKLGTKIYRLLAKYKRNKDSSVVFVKVKVPINEEYAEKDVFNKDEVSRRKNNQLGKHISNNIGDYELSRKNNSSVCTRRDSNFGKRIYDHIYYKNHVRFATNDDFKFLKSSKKRKINMLRALFIIYLPIVILNIAMIDFSNWGLRNIFPEGWKIPIIILIYILPMVFMPLAIFICKKVEKYDKMLYIKSKMNNRKYRPSTNISF
ncbi:uncharacterized protein MKS88_000207 [Plasmodium brasilianum]|uniref:uncharacterized protein n=1 Tax=Plasmodium brasilianum TaxID=5824 RepID=UPI00350E51A3|nr:hypothetical protein MKS88_000207 [Plasmodium brasilianum]